MLCKLGSVFEGVGVMVGRGVDGKVDDCYACDRIVEDVSDCVLSLSFRMLCEVGIRFLRRWIVFVLMLEKQSVVL